MCIRDSQNTLKHPTTHRKGFAKELVRNPLILATGGGLLANLAGVHIPPWLEPTVTRIGGASLALGLMAAGAGMQLGLSLIHIQMCIRDRSPKAIDDGWEFVALSKII